MQNFEALFCICLSSQMPFSQSPDGLSQGGQGTGVFSLSLFIMAFTTSIAVSAFPKLQIE
jgi:hypothetical protein